MSGILPPQMGLYYWHVQCLKIAPTQPFSQNFVHTHAQICELRTLCLQSQDYHLSGVFGSSLYLPLCPLPGTNALYTTAYGLLLPILAIITIVVYIIR